MKNFIYVQLFVILLLAGCSDNLPLRGKVTFPDGEPLGIGTVYFEKAGFVARGDLRANGTYDVGSLGSKDGLPAGTYKVYITGAGENLADPANPSRTIYRPLIASEFTDVRTTPLTITVPGERVYDITVERPKE